MATASVGTRDHARDPRVESANDAAESFATALRRLDHKDRHVHIERGDAVP
ncbi:MAG TPA: hypothetical protein VF516_45480 [Kofleriaceae bacterium]